MSSAARGPRRDGVGVPPSDADPGGDRPARNARPTRLRHWVPPKVIPKHVRHCHRGTGSRLWWLYTWQEGSPHRRIRVPYSCNSWRCETCAPHEAAVLFRRITEACSPLDPLGFVFVVLTLDQRGYFDNRVHGWRRFRDVQEAYRELGHQSELFLKRVRRWQKREGMTAVGHEWFAVVEAYLSGWPHMNLVLFSPVHPANPIQALPSARSSVLRHVTNAPAASDPVYGGTGRHELSARAHVRAGRACV